jgi:MFS family permease
MAAAPTLGPITAIQAMTPAFERTKQQLIQPFRIWRWSRLALTALLAGEMGSGGNWGRLGDLGGPHRSNKGNDLFLLAAPPWADWHDYLPVIAAAVISAMLLMVIFIYVSSVFRFILFDSVLTERVHIREGWRRWHDRGGRFFLWQIGFSAVMITLVGLVVGLPVLSAWRGGLFDHPNEHVGALILGGFLMLFVGGALLIASALVGVFTKDFVVPLMALEELSAIEAWHRLLPMLKSEKGSYAGYIGMKIVLAIASGILFGILSVIALLLALVPLAVLGILAAALVAALGLTWNPLTVVLAVLLGAVVGFGLLWVMALVSVPSVVFFQSYTLYFFGSRYARLGAILAPPAPPPPPAMIPVPA